MTRREPSRRRPAAALCAVFVAVPIVVFGVPALFGLPWLVGDNAIQNYPLRVLVGTDLAHGHLPIWDPYIWSGAPLLAGFNAGAAYPVTALFAVLPHVLAWVSNQVVAEVVAALGMLILLRGHGRSWTAAGLGAASFAYGGFVVAQNVHIDLVEAAGWLVWAFAAVDRVAAAPRRRQSLAWTGMLGLSLGLMALTGATEPLLDGGLVLVLYAIWHLWRARGARMALSVRLVAGAVIGGCIGAAQLLPGLLFQSQSQRATHTYTYFASGSMNKSFLTLLFDPLFLGGSHSYPFGFVGTYNLPEISGYVGIVPVMAVFGLLARRHRRHAEASSWWIWYAIAAVGALFALGSFTPLGHLEYLLPLYNRQRLLTRNLLELDIALVVLFAAWVDHMLLSPRPPPTEVSTSPARKWRRWPSDVVLPLVPVAAVVFFQLATITVGPFVLDTLYRVPDVVSYGNLWRQDIFLVVPSAVALAAGWLVVHGWRVGAARVARILTVVVVFDLVLFNAMTQIDPLPTAAVNGPSPDSRALTAMVRAAGTGHGGEEHRTALYDPAAFDVDQAADVGEPDVNILQSLDSVQGYGAVVDGNYDQATGTHTQGNIATLALAAGTMAYLDLGVLVTVPQSFLHLVVPAPGVPTGVVRIPPVGPRPQVASPTAVAPPTPPREFTYLSAAPASLTLEPGKADAQYFGTVLAVRSVRIPLTRGGPTGTTRLRLGLVSADGRSVHWLEGPQGIVLAGGLRVAVQGSPEVSGIVVVQVPGTGPPPTVSMGQAVVDTAGQGTYRLDGGLRDVVTEPDWHFAGTIGVFSVFTESDAVGRAYLTQSSAGSATVTSDPAWGTETIEVRTTRPATLVRDVTFASGWQAEITPPPNASGPTVSVDVVRHGLVQSVKVPAGTHLVTFRYRPHRVDEGLALSAVGVLAALLLVIFGCRGSWRRRTRPAAPG